MVLVSSVEVGCGTVPKRSQAPAVTHLRLAEPRGALRHVREFPHAAGRRIGVRDEDLVIELVRWGALCDELDRMPTHEEYARRYETSPDEARVRLAKFIAEPGRLRQGSRPPLGRHRAPLVTQRRHAGRGVHRRVRRPLRVCLGRSDVPGRPWRGSERCTSDTAELAAFARRPVRFVACAGGRW